MSLPDGFKTDDSKPPLEAVPPKTEEGENLVDIIKETLKSPEFIKTFASLHKIRRPDSVARNSVCSYYREIFALESKVTLDIMLENPGQDMIWSYSDYPEMKPSSVYMRVYHSIRYLIDYLDPEGKYRELRDKTILHKETNGVCLRWVRDKLDGRTFIGKKLSDREKTYAWKDEVEKFLEDDKVDKLHLKKLSLTTQEIETLQLSFEGIKGIIYFVTEKEILLRKTKDDTSENTGQGYDS